jgi:RND family efflux transporter MFP subunit
MESLFRTGVDVMEPSRPSSAVADADFNRPLFSEPSGRGGLNTKIVGALAALAVVVALTWLHFAGREAAPPTAEAAPQRTVTVAKPEYTAVSTLILPANVDAFQTTLVYARVNGYLLRWHADIGDHVKAGQALAEIDTPEADQELDQAQANLVQGRADLDTAKAEFDEAQAALKQADADVARAKANHDFARSVLGRNQQLSARHVIADQDLDESRRDDGARRADVDAAAAGRTTRERAIVTASAKIKSHEATVASLEANVRRLVELQGFKTIRAPFDGIVIRRRAEIGCLVSAGSGTNSEELFAVAQSDTLRIRVNVPQAQAMTIATGQAADVRVVEYPGRTFTARVARTSRAIDPVSRTLMVELELPNADQTLLPGTYAQVTLPVRRSEPMCTIPGGVLLNQPDGQKVAIVDAGNTVRLQKVKLGRDFGSRMEVLAGLRGDENLIVNPPDDLADRERVTIAAGADGPDSQGAPSVVAHNEPKPRS